MNLTKAIDKTAYWMGYAAFHEGKEISEAVGEALLAIADESGLQGDEMVTLTTQVIGSTVAGWEYAKVTKFRADRF
jgi:hypothetical protein